MTLQTEKNMLRWLNDQHTAMLDKVIDWAKINTFTFNKAGMTSLYDDIEETFAPLEADVERVALPELHFRDARGQPQTFRFPPALLVQKRPDRVRQALLVVHTDTAYAPQTSLQDHLFIQGRQLKGRGVTDAKSGLAVAWKALEALEDTEHASDCGWTLAAVPDGKIGTPCSAALLRRLAQRATVGFVFDPSLPDGTLINSRFGTADYTVIFQQDSSPASLGASPTEALLHFILLCRQTFRDQQTLLWQAGPFLGNGESSTGTPLALLHFQIAFAQWEDFEPVSSLLAALKKTCERETGLSPTVIHNFTIAPQPARPPSSKIQQFLMACGREIGLRLQFTVSPFSSLANRLHEAGLPTMDTLGGQGGYDAGEEFLYIQSLKDRARLTALALVRWVRGGILPAA